MSNKQSTKNSRGRKAKSLRSADRDVSRRVRQRTDTYATAPVAISRSGRVTNPRFSGGENFIIVHKREFIGEVVKTASTTWKIEKSYQINPGNNLLFPWLSSMATNWESYNIESMKFIYASRAPTSTAGAVQMWVDYDVADPAPTNEVLASSAQQFTEAAIWTPNFAYQCDLKGLRQGKDHHYISFGVDIPVGADPTNYFAGKFYVAMSGNAVGTGGALYVEYSIRLMIPQKGVSLSAIPPTDATFAFIAGDGGSDDVRSVPTTFVGVVADPAPQIKGGTALPLVYQGAVEIKADNFWNAFRLQAGYSYVLAVGTYMNWDGGLISGNIVASNLSTSSNWSNAADKPFWYKDCALPTNKTLTLYDGVFTISAGSNGDQAFTNVAYLTITPDNPGTEPQIGFACYSDGTPDMIRSHLFVAIISRSEFPPPTLLSAPIETKVEEKLTAPILAATIVGEPKVSYPKAPCVSRTRESREERARRETSMTSTPLSK